MKGVIVCPHEGDLSLILMFPLLKRGVDLISATVDVMEFLDLIFEVFAFLFHVLEMLFFLF